MPQASVRNKPCECGHLPVSHRYGACEAVTETGWVAAFNRFTKVVRCDCKKYRPAKNRKSA